MSYSIETEKSIINILLKEPELYPDVFSVLSESDFYFGYDSVQTGLIVTQIKKMIDEGLDFTDIKLLSQRANLPQDYFDDFMNINPAPKSSNLSVYVDTVRKNALNRKLVKFKNDVSGVKTDGNIEDTYEQVEQLTLELKKHIYQYDNFEDDKIQSVINKYLERVARDVDLPLHERRMETPFDDVNKIIGGIYRNDFSILAARPGMGKSAFASQLVVDHLVKVYPDETFVYAILETSPEQLLERFIAEQTGIPLFEIRDLTFVADKIKKAKFDLAIEKLRSKKVRLWGNECTNLKVLKRKVLAEPNIKLLVVDYIQLMNNGRRGNNRNNDLGEIAQELAGLAVDPKNNSMHVMAVAQLNRSCESRQDKRPMLSDLRDSGEFEQAAHLVMALYRDTYYNSNSELRTPEGDVTELLTLKNRNKTTGVSRLLWSGKEFRFKNLPIGFNMENLTDDDDNIFG